MQYEEQATALALQAFTLQLRQGIAVRIAFERTAGRAKVADASIPTSVRTPVCVAAGNVNPTAINSKGNIRVISRIFIR